jgi:hypothetical protein
MSLVSVNCADDALQWHRNAVDPQCRMRPVPTLRRTRHGRPGFRQIHCKPLELPSFQFSGRRPHDLDD